MDERVAQLIAHRACTNEEHDPQNGKLAGFCVVCGVPWPCKTAKPTTPVHGEEFVWMAAEPGKWGEQTENVHEIMETLPNDLWLVRWLDFDGSTMMTLVRRNDEGRLVRDES